MYCLLAFMPAWQQLLNLSLQRLLHATVHATKIQDIQGLPSYLQVIAECRLALAAPAGLELGLA
jgi:hypothetical protein